MREISRLYEEHRSLTHVVEDVSRRGWTGKARLNSDGESYGGRPLYKPALYRLLVNRPYAGRIKCRGSLVAGEHGGIVEDAAWARVQAHTCAATDQRATRESA